MDKFKEWWSRQDKWLAIACIAYVMVPSAYLAYAIYIASKP